ncbi:MAG: hypothetical protein U0798_14380 [Gemmataceae bacterium]
MGYKAGSAEIAVKLNGNEVARKVVEFKEGGPREVLSFVPQPKDVQPGAGTDNQHSPVHRISI